MSENHPTTSPFQHDAGAQSEADHLLDLCSRSIRRLKEMAALDPLPPRLLTGEADALEKYVIELKLMRHSRS